jgi:hypothetical protein
MYQLSAGVGQPNKTVSLFDTGVRRAVESKFEKPGGLSYCRNCLETHRDDD